MCVWGGGMNLIVLPLFSTVGIRRGDVEAGQVPVSG